jgi:hypothetical protein
MNDHLIVEINEKLNFKKVTCKEGHYITDWDREDILKYTSSKIMYCPININLDVFYCVTDEENDRLMDEQIQAIENLHNERK